MPAERRDLPPRGRTRVMGVLNLTPDSFSDGGRFRPSAGPEPSSGPSAPAFRPDVEAVVVAARALVASGAELLDVGAMSTRPGSAGVAPEEEWARLEGCWPALRAAVDVPLSLDTTSAAVLRHALAAGGVDLLNDTSALADDPGLAALVAREGLPVVLMHRRGSPADMQAAPHYEDVVTEVRAELLAAAARAVEAGIARERILLDPGIGFGKRPQDNLALLAHLDALLDTGHRLVLGTSRKAFLGLLTGRGIEGRGHATTATTVLAALAGVDFVRVHDAGAAADALAIVRGVEAAR